jgi:hypothetical protein
VRDRNMRGSELGPVSPRSHRGATAEAKEIHELVRLQVPWKFRREAQFPSLKFTTSDCPPGASRMNGTGTYKSRHFLPPQALPPNLPPRRDRMCFKLVIIQYRLPLPWRRFHRKYDLMIIVCKTKKIKKIKQNKIIKMIIIINST